MKFSFLLILFSCWLIVAGQVISKEAFANMIEMMVVESSFSKYYLSYQAHPCRFKSFDYGQLIQYSLKEIVPLHILNELAKQVYQDTADLQWIPGKLDKAICIDEEQIRSILNPTWAPRYDHHLSEKQRKKAIKNVLKNWNKKPPEEKLVFFFSRPEFTEDHQYVVIDLDYRCDEHECGSLSTFLFRWEMGKWKTIGIISTTEEGGG